MGAGWVRPQVEAPFDQFVDWDVDRVDEVLRVFKGADLDFGGDEAVVAALLEGDRAAAREAVRLFAVDAQGGIVNVLSLIVGLVIAAAPPSSEGEEEGKSGGPEAAAPGFPPPPTTGLERKLDLVYDAFDLDDAEALQKEDLSVLVISALRAVALVTGVGREPTDLEGDHVATRAYALLDKRHSETLSRADLRRFVGDVLGADCRTVASLMFKFGVLDDADDDDDDSSLPDSPSRRGSQRRSSSSGTVAGIITEAKLHLDERGPIPEADLFTPDPEVVAAMERENSSTATRERRPEASRLLCTLGFTLRSRRLICSFWQTPSRRLRVRGYDAASAVTYELLVAQREWAPHLGALSEVALDNLLEQDDKRRFCATIARDLRLDDGEFTYGRVKGASSPAEVMSPPVAPSPAPTGFPDVGFEEEAPAPSTSTPDIIPPVSHFFDKQMRKELHAQMGDDEQMRDAWQAVLAKK